MTSSSRHTYISVCFALSLVFLSLVSSAQTPRDNQSSGAVTAGQVIVPPTLGGTWRPVGPAPKRNGQAEGAAPNNEVSGAVHALAAHPTDPNILYAGAVNGGIWKTINAAAASPTWVQQTDPQLSLSIGALEFDPLDATRQTLLAGIGEFSSFGNGGRRLGVLRTVNGGDRWVRIDGGISGKNISGVAPRGSVMVVSVDYADLYTYDQVGVFRSTDSGSTFTQISVGNGSTTGLPGGVAFDLAGDPTNPARLFTGLIFADGVGGRNGIYRSTDTGATWTKVSNAAMDSLITGATYNIEIAVGRNNNVYVVTVNNSGRLSGLFRSADGGTTWTALDVPNTHPGGQGWIHLSLVADPTNSNLVYVGGDRAELGEFGANDYSGRLFRCDASAASGSQCVHLTHSSESGPAGGGTLSSSSPHADSRELVFDAAGNLIESDDGGVFRRTNPRTNQGDWFSISSNLQVFEFHSIAYDSNAKIVVGGAQDNGTGYQSAPGATIWNSVSNADGGDVAIDILSSPGLSIRYSSYQFLGAFYRLVFDSNNVPQFGALPALDLIGDGVEPSYSFVTPIRLNTVNPSRLIIGAGNGVYESFDQGETIRQLLPALPVNESGGHPIGYGAVGNPDILYIGSQDTVWVRTAPPPAQLVQSVNYPGTGTGRPVINLALDPRDPLTTGVIDDSTVYLSRNAGESWANITGNLQSFNPGQLRSIVFVSNATGDAVVVGTSNGVFVALASSGYTFWDRLGDGLPSALVYQLDYSSSDDLLVAGTLGRGAWALSHPTFSTTLFTATFEALPDGFRFIDDAFGTNQPAYAAGELSGGRLRVAVGGVDDTSVLGMSGGWQRSFYLGSPQAVSLSLDFNMTQTPEYESDEFSQTLARIDNQTIIEVAKITGDGSGGAPVSTGPTSRVLDLGCLPPGTRSLTIGVRNNKKTRGDQSTELLLDNVVLKTHGSCLIP
jgi:hypothetical protein